MKNIFYRYTFLGILNLIISFIFTKLFYPHARLIRLPFDIRGKQQISFGYNFTTGFNCRLEVHNDNFRKKALFIGNNVQINDFVHIAAKESVTIGDNVLIASKVFISDISHGIYSGDFQDHPDSIPVSRKIYGKPVVIENNVWIGESVNILSGVTIGFGSIIGAGTIVSKNVPPNSIVVGNPARVIKKFNSTKNNWERF